MGERKLRIIFDSDFRNVDMARAAIGGVCRELFRGPGSESRILDFTLAFTEAMNNAVEHSGSKSVVVELVSNNNEVLFRMLTEGEKYAPAATASMPLLDNEAELPEGGFGLAIIRQLVDKMDYEYLDNKNVLTLKKTLSDKE